MVVCECVFVPRQWHWAVFQVLLQEDDGTPDIHLAVSPYT